jgi:hypothetical protein
MSIIPLDIQRRCEQRWAARFLQPTANTPQRQFERQDQEQATPGNAKTITHWVKAESFRAPTG